MPFTLDSFFHPLFQDNSCEADSQCPSNERCLSDRCECLPPFIKDGTSCKRKSAPTSSSLHPSHLNHLSTLSLFYSLCHSQILVTGNNVVKMLNALLHQMVPFASVNQVAQEIQIQDVKTLMNVPHSCQLIQMAHVDHQLFALIS